MRLRDESGQALVLMAFGFAVLLAFLAVAVDVGRLFHIKRKLQIAADAAALAGAQDYAYNGSTSSARTQADNASSINGYTDGAGGVVVTVNLPPVDGPNADLPGFVEATVSTPVNTLFMALLGVSSTTLEARAVAGSPTNGNACIWLLNPSGTGLALQGKYDIEAPSCGIYVNSDTSNAVTVTGNGGTVNALFLDAVGDTVPKHATNPTPVTPDSVPRTNPWGEIDGPDPITGSGCTTVDSSTTTISGSIPGPGAGNSACYTQAVTLNGATIGTGTLGGTVAGDTVGAAAGTLVFGNGVTIAGTVTIFGGTIDVYGGTFNQPSNTVLNVVAPTSGKYNGISLMQPTTNTNELQVQFGSNNQVLDGYIYAPGAEVYLQDHGGGITATGVVASWMFIKASTVTIPSYDSAHPTTTPNRVLTMVE